MASLPIHQHNNKIVLCLSENMGVLFPSLPFDSFLRLLEKAPAKIERVHIDGNFLNGISAYNQAKLFLEIGRFPSLQDLYVGRARINPANLTFPLKVAMKLKSLQLVHVELNGDKDDFRDFESGLYCHESLRSISLIDSRLSLPQSCINSLVGTLSSIPNLERVEIYPRFNVDISLPSRLRHLCHYDPSSKLQELCRVPNFPVHNIWLN
eukprot:scaffold4510_cov183-Amphora_coffeaeformis.AAC.87